MLMFWDIEGVNDIRKMQFLPFHHSIIPPAGMQDKAGNQGKANSLEIFFFSGHPRETDENGMGIRIESM